MSGSKRTLWAVAALVLATLACTLIGGGGQVAEGEITVVINSPTDDSQVAVGQEVMVQMTINDPAGVVNREELLVDGVVVASSEAVAPAGSPAFSIIMPYTPTQAGTFVVSAIAYGSDGSQSQPATFTLIVGGEAEEEAEPEEETAQPTPTVNPTPVPDTVRGCTNDMRYVRDVNIPDGTKMTPGQAFTKTWEIRNSGTCDWGGYQLVFHSNNQMGGPASVTVPATPAGATVQVSVNLVAPNTPGSYRSSWTMRSPDGDLFGNVIFALIEVEGAAPSGDGPDLVVVSVSTDPDEPEAGAVTTYEVVVKNQGNEDAASSTLLGEFEGAGTATEPVPALGPNESETVSLTETTPSAGVFEASFTADSEDDVDEINEGNNTLAFDITYVSILQSGALSTSEFSSFDLDLAASHGGNCGAADDFHWEGDAPGVNQILEPCNGAKIVLMGSSQAGFDECSAASLGTADLDISGSVGMWVCAQTSSGHYSAFRIDDLGSATQPLKLTYKVYD